MSGPAQINYNAHAAKMFARLAQNMLNEDMPCGPPQYIEDHNSIIQLYGMDPFIGGVLFTFVDLGDGRWHVTDDDECVDEIITINQVEDLFNGNL